VKSFTIEDRQKRELEKPLKVYLCGSNERQNEKQNEIGEWQSWVVIDVVGRVEEREEEGFGEAGDKIF
jgi:hypothetical protein